MTRSVGDEILQTPCGERLKVPGSTGLDTYSHGLPQTEKNCKEKQTNKTKGRIT